MLALPPTHPHNWYRHALVHVFDCPHGNWWFLPWHRGYLGWFERIIRARSGDDQFTLPFWDWTASPQVPSALFTDVLNPDHDAYIASFAAFRAGFSGPMAATWRGLSAAQRKSLQERGFRHPQDFWDHAEAMFFARPDGRTVSATNPALDELTRSAVNGRVIRLALQEPAFSSAGTRISNAGFASGPAASHNGASAKGVLESQPHDNIHGALGGDTGKAWMVAFLSPVDPLFFLHHCNIDRLWDVWTRRQAALNRAPLPQGTAYRTWAAERFPFFTNAEGKPETAASAGDYASVAALGYSYATGFGEDLVPPPSALVANLSPVRPLAARLARPPAAGARLAGAGARGLVTIPAEALRPRPDGTPITAQVTLNLVPGDLGRRFRVLMGREGNPPVQSGALTVFGHHTQGPASFAVPVPAIVLSLADAGRPLSLEISVVSVGAAPAGQGPVTRGPDPGAPVPLAGITVFAR